MRFFYTVLLQVLFISLSAQNNQVLVKGKVFDKLTEKPLSEVQIIYDNNIEAVTDLKGSFEIYCNPGEARLTFMLIGYETFSESIQLKSDSQYELSVVLEPTVNQLNEVVISADKTEKLISELSVSVNVIKPEDIINNHITDAEEIIKQTQGIDVIDGQAAIRGGSGFSYGAGSRVLALIDGLPAISADAGNIRWQFLPLENLAQIEIIKGASSVLYGSSALNGVINFINKSVDTTQQINVSLTAGIYDKPNSKNWLWWDSPRMYADASFSFSQRLKNTELSIGSNVLFNNGYRKLNDEKLARLNFKIKQHSKKVKGLSYGTGFLGGYNIKTDFILWENSDTGALKQNEATATELNAQFYTIDPFISYNKNSSNHDIRIRLQISDNQYFENTANNSMAISNFSEYQFMRKFFDKLNVIVGISDFYSMINSEFYGNHIGNNISAYSQLEYNLFERLKISAGIRAEYNKLDSISDQIVPVFRSGINYKAGKGTFLRASFGQAYRYPSVAEKFAYTSLGAVKIFPNKEIRPEYGWSSEIGLKQGVRSGRIFGHFDLSLFYSQNSDMIEYVFGLYHDPVTDGFDFGFRSSNIENSKVYGAETEFHLSRNFEDLQIDIGGGYTYIYPIEFNETSNLSTTEWLKYRKKHAAKIYIRASLKKFEIAVNTFYKSKVLNIDNVFLNPLTREQLLPGFYDYWLTANKGYVLTDVFLSYRIKGNIKLSFAVKNIGNTEYSDRPGNIMPHRFYSLQLSARF